MCTLSYTHASQHFMYVCIRMCVCVCVRPLQRKLLDTRPVPAWFCSQDHTVSSTIKTTVRRSMWLWLACGSSSPALIILLQNAVKPLASTSLSLFLCLARVSTSPAFFIFL